MAGPAAGGGRADRPGRAVRLPGGAGGRPASGELLDVAADLPGRRDGDRRGDLAGRRRLAHRPPPSADPASATMTSVATRRDPVRGATPTEPAKRSRRWRSRPLAITG